jgi:hypothetical protein
VGYERERGREGKVKVCTLGETCAQVDNRKENPCRDKRIHGRRYIHTHTRITRTTHALGNRKLFKKKKKKTPPKMGVKEARTLLVKEESGKKTLFYISLDRLHP